MNHRYRLLIVLSVILLGLTFFVPLWGIQLWAPQYPEGLLVSLWIDKITGDVQNLNVLNHYIGMAPIHPEDFKELKYFPMCIGILMGTGLLAAFFNKRFGLRLWSLLLIGASLLAFYDFYAWETHFGSNLSPDAAIKVEGISYQPPLIGVERILNIEVWSLPDAGGYLVFVAVALAALGLILDLRPPKKRGLLLILFFFIGACSSFVPEPIDWGSDLCHECKMVLTDRRFGAEAQSPKGKFFKFDSYECLFAFLNKQSSLHKIYVVNMTPNGGLIEAQKAYFLETHDLKSPMGKGILASDDPQALQAFQKNSGEELWSWTDVEKHYKNAP